MLNDGQNRPSVRQISILACLFLVLLRVSIGWQFLYEGLWKLNTQGTSQAWVADGYLANSQGPFRNVFRSLVPDVDGLETLDYNKVTQKWDNWQRQFIDHFRGPHALTEEQIRELREKLDGPPEFVERLSALPPGVDLSAYDPDKAKDGKTKFLRPYPPKEGYVRFLADKKLLVTNIHLLSTEVAAISNLAKAGDDADAKKLVDEFKRAVKRLGDRSSKLSLKERLRVLLLEDRDRNGVINEDEKGTIDYQRPGEREVYVHLLQRYEQNAAKAKTAYDRAHLEKQWSEIQEKKAALVGPVNALSAELQNHAYELLTTKQIQAGAAAPLKSNSINAVTIWTLIILGGLMIVGLFSRASSLGAAGLLLMFYLAMPPWPGVPEPPGMEHSLFVNKNFIEIVACLALAALPTGRWAGLDGLLRWLMGYRKTD